MSTETTSTKNIIKILLVENIHLAAIDIFETSGYVSITSIKRALTEDELIDAIQDIHILGIRSKTTITEKILSNAPNLTLKQLLKKELLFLIRPSRIHVQWLSLPLLKSSC